jgi:alpha-L-rhamnosidase
MTFSKIVVAGLIGLAVLYPSQPVGAACLYDEGQQGVQLRKTMIWAASASVDQQQYVAFRKVFDLTAEPKEACLRLFSDTRYLLWINGRYVDQGPCRFDPKRPEYDTLDVRRFLQKGHNVIVVLVHHYAGISHGEKSRFMEHVPGLTAALDATLTDGSAMTLATDTTWRANSHTRYRPEVEVIFSSVRDNIDARIDAGDWTQSDFDDSAWEAGVEIDGNTWGKMFPRGIPLLRETIITPEYMARETIAGQPEKNRDYRQLLADRLPLTMHKGHEIILDVGKTVQAYSVLDFDAEAGSTLEVQYGVIFYNTQKHKLTSSLNDSPNHYIARAGRQTYMSTDTFGCRYVAIRVMEGSITLHSARMVNRLYPYARIGRFICNDAMLNQLWTFGANTVEVCSEDAYVDCIDRERGQWDADGFLMGFPVSCAVLAGPSDMRGNYRFMDTRLVRNMIRHVGLSQLPDGRLLTLRPSNRPPDEIHAVLDDYSCLWMQHIRIYYDMTGDEGFVREVWPTFVKAVEYYLGRRTEHGLVLAREFTYPNNPLAYKTCEGATFNAYFYSALLDGAYLANVIGDSKQAEIYKRAAEELHERFNEQLWDAAANSYYGAIMEGNKTEPTGHAALLALYYDIVPTDRRASVLQFMLDHFDDGFPYAWYFYLHVLYRQNTPELDVQALNTIRRKWAENTENETETTTESLGGMGVHEAGSHPTYFLSRFVLGVRDTGTFKDRHIVIEPRLGDLQRVEGTTLTSSGPVYARFHQAKKIPLSFQLEIPAGGVVDVALPRLIDSPTLTLNGQTLIKKGIPAENTAIDDRYIRFQIQPGLYEGTITKE